MVSDSSWEDSSRIYKKKEYNFKNKLHNIFCLHNHQAWEISSIFRLFPVAQFLLILVTIMFLFLVFSQMFFIISSFHVWHTCLHLWRLSRLSSPTISHISLRISSGSMSKLSFNVADIFNGTRIFYFFLNKCFTFLCWGWSANQL